MCRDNIISCHPLVTVSQDTSSPSGTFNGSCQHKHFATVTALKTTPFKQHCCNCYLWQKLHTCTQEVSPQKRNCFGSHALSVAKHRRQKKRLRRKEPVASYIYEAINTSQSETSHWELNEPLKSGDELADRRDWSAVISFAGPCSSRRWLVEREAGVTGDDEGAAEEKREGGEGASRFEEGSLQSAVVPHPVWCSVCKYLEREREKKERGGLTGWLTRGVFCCYWVQVVCIAEGSLLCLSLGFLPEKNIFKCS